MNKYIHPTFWEKFTLPFTIDANISNINEWYAWFHLKIDTHEKAISFWFQPVEEELKQELISLDVEKIIDDIKPCFDWSAVRYYQLREVLSKYGTTPQKKRTEQEIRNMYYYTSSQNNDYNINDTLAPWIIITFLRKVWLLQE